MSQDLQQASQVLNALVNAPAALSGPPQWAVDMQNFLHQNQSWDTYIIKIMNHNSSLAIGELAHPPPLPTSSLSSGAHPPAPPVPSAPPPILPPAFNPLAAILPPPPHPLFPVNKGALQVLNNPNLQTLLLAYNCPVPNGLLPRRATFAEFIGVPLLQNSLSHHQHLLVPNLARELRGQSEAEIWEKFSQNKTETIFDQNRKPDSTFETILGLGAGQQFTPDIRVTRLGLQRSDLLMENAKLSLFQFCNRVRCSELAWLQASARILMTSAELLSLSPTSDIPFDDI
ncbi:hypothetical protein B0H10DRAFT_2351904 [Mycena sp. CBHHK59/15]|nr:hypothetical protein B0H10DRAFT_2351904 [Mycena sp. CBHHK59/15]